MENSGVMLINIASVVMECPLNMLKDWWEKKFKCICMSKQMAEIISINHKDNKNFIATFTQNLDVTYLWLILENSSGFHQDNYNQ